MNMEKIISATIQLINTCSLDVVQPTYASSRGRQERTTPIMWH